jgi:hypothetical protein
MSLEGGQFAKSFETGDEECSDCSITSGTATRGLLSDWINDRFAGRAAPNNCSSIPVGNALDPIPLR